MRVAALYDVHGNLPALDAVLAGVPDDAAIVVGGDVAAGLFPAETLERLRALGDRVHWLRGNADRELTPGEEGLAPAQMLDWVRTQLSDEQIAFLHGLPPSVTLDVDGVGRVLFVHATPRNDVDIFTERTPEERVAPSFAGVDADLVVCGHTHTQFEREIAGLRVLNAGSVGMAYEDAPGAYWALVGPDVQHRRSTFEPRESDYPDEWPSASRDEAVSHFETLAVGS
ncbi:MAG: metallophosphatase family protein [Actinomycetia bacterium]|nr:metallophosphatase family protein [Actinomycetes bacterium]